MAGRVHHPVCAVSVAAFGDTEAFECDDAEVWTHLWTLILLIWLVDRWSRSVRRRLVA